MAISDGNLAADWDEARYVSSLAQLERLNNQLNALRNTIPSIMNPVLHHQDSKSDTFTQLHKAVVSANTDIKEFKERWQSEGVQATLAKSREGLERDDDLGAARELPRNGWIEKAA